MTSHLFLRGSLATLFALGALGVARTAGADPTSCAADSDCTKGFTCQVVGATACAGTACAVPPAGADAEACPPPPVCDPTVIKGCMPGPCTTDSDCATGMVCYADTYTSCPPPEPVPICPKNADCAAPAIDAGVCTTTTMNSCVPRYDLPCKVASDCGDGFTCAPDTTTECSGGGSAGSGVASGSTGTTSGPAVLVDASPVTVGAEDASSPPPSCTTTVSSTSSCQAKSIPCTTAANCPSTWTCVAQPEPATEICAGPASFDGGVAPCGTPDPTPPQSLCEPPYANLGSNFGGSPLLGTGTAPVAPTAGGTPANGGATSSTSAPTGSIGGCQMAAPGAATGGIPLLALLGLTALSRRRRSS
jgi:MYXO-CTERM domain-containing protein